MERPHILSSEFLEPATKLENPPKFNLTCFDDVMATVPYQQRILFYSSIGEGSSFEDLVQLLKRSLAQVLVVFYPFAGRIISEDGVLDCGIGQSVKFSQAVTSTTLTELGDFSPSEYCNSLCDLGEHPPKHPWTADDPLLFIQVTRFGCGGISLGFAFSHNVVDGTSAWHFMNSWSELVRTGSIKVAPDITYGYNLPKLTDQEAAQVGDELNLIPDDVEEFHVKEGKKLVTKTYLLDREMIEKLKSRATAETNGRKFSTFVVINAFLWRQITIARRLPESSKSRFITIVNCRGRNTSISKAYFGNAVSVTLTSLEAGEIERNGFWHCASHLHDTISAFDVDKADRSVAYFLWLKNSSKFSAIARAFSMNMVQAIGSPRHPVYETDFGFGRPVGVTFGTIDLGDGKVYLFPSPKGDGSVSATVVLDSEVLERFSV